MRKLAFILLVVAALSCGRNAPNSEYNPPVFKIDRIAEVNLFASDKVMGAVSLVRVVDKYLFISSLADNSYIQVFDKNTGKYMKSLAHKGNGPGEFLFHVLSFDSIQDTLYLSCNYNESPLFIYKTEDFVGGGQMLGSVQIKGGSRSYKHIYPLRDGFLSAPLAQGLRFALHNREGEIVYKYHTFPSLGTDVDTNILWKAFQMRTDIAVKPDRKRFAAATFLGAALEIYSTENNRIELLKEVKMFPPKLLLRKERGSSIIHPDCMIGMWNVVTTDEYIYVVFLGKKMKDYDNDLLADHIYVFNWEGKPVKSYRVPCKVSFFDVDEESDRIYITTKNEEGIDILGYFDI